MVARETYLSKLRQLKDHNVIKVITGIRRSGKSTLLEAFKDELISQGVARSSIVFPNFEERENLNFTNWTTLYDEIIRSIGTGHKTYVFLDEVQLINDFEKLINSLYVKKNIDLYVTGSNAYLLSGELATLLTGRYIAIIVHPYSFKEYVLANKNEDNGTAYLQVSQQQLFSRSAIFSTERELAKTSPAYFLISHIIKDIVRRHKLRNIHNLHRIISFLFDSVVHMFLQLILLQNSIKVHKKISHNTIIKY